MKSNKKTVLLIAFGGFFAVSAKEARATAQTETLQTGKWDLEDAVQTVMDAIDGALKQSFAPLESHSAIALERLNGTRSPQRVAEIMQEFTGKVRPLLESLRIPSTEAREQDREKADALVNYSGRFLNHLERLMTRIQKAAGGAADESIGREAASFVKALVSSIQITATDSRKARIRRDIQSQDKFYKSQTKIIPVGGSFPNPKPRQDERATVSPDSKKRGVPVQSLDPSLEQQVEQLVRVIENEPQGSWLLEKIGDFVEVINGAAKWELSFRLDQLMADWEQTSERPHLPSHAMNFDYALKPVVEEIQGRLYKPNPKVLKGLEPLLEAYRGHLHSLAAIEVPIEVEPAKIESKITSRPIRVSITSGPEFDPTTSNTHDPSAKVIYFHTKRSKKQSLDKLHWGSIGSLKRMKYSKMPPSHGR